MLIWTIIKNITLRKRSCSRTLCYIEEVFKWLVFNYNNHTYKIDVIHFPQLHLDQMQLGMCVMLEIIWLASNAFKELSQK